MKFEAKDRLTMSKGELGALCSFMGKDIYRPHLTSLHLSDKAVFATDGKRILVCEAKHSLDLRVDAAPFKRILRFMDKDDQVQLRFAKRSGAAMVRRNVFPLVYINAPKVPMRDVIPKGSQAALFAADPNLIMALSGVCKAIAPGMQPMFKLEHAEEVGPLLFSFPYQQDWKAVIMGCRAP